MLILAQKTKLGWILSGTTEHQDHIPSTISLINVDALESEMEEVPVNEIYTRPAYYLPHHAVVKAESTSTKVGVVFDASYKAPSGQSLNLLSVGGLTIQDPMCTKVTHWRIFKIALKADIEKMYRQVLVDRKDVDYQRIVWRPSMEAPITYYRLKIIHTVQTVLRSRQYERYEG